MDHVTDPLLITDSDSAGNRTRDLLIRSPELRLCFCLFLNLACSDSGCGLVASFCGCEDELPVSVTSTSKANTSKYCVGLPQGENRTVIRVPLLRQLSLSLSLYSWGT
jgi:hypothetical protein